MIDYQKKTDTNLEKNYSSYTFPNGLRVVHKHSYSNVAYCGFFVNVGSRNEKADEYGMAHFIEHMLFKGTKKRKSYQIIKRMDTVGGELNAFTNKEETVIYSTFLKEHYQRAIELMTDVILHSDFPQKEIEKEIDVVKDEINSYLDSPAELIYDEFENQIFKNTPFGHSILGTEESLNSFDHQKITSFFRNHYKLSKMVFFSYGDISFNELLKKLGNFLPNENTQVLDPNKFSLSQKMLLQDIHAEHILVDKNTMQAHVMLGTLAYPIYDEKRRVLSLVNNILGGPGMNSRLNMSLREKKGYVYNIESNISVYTDTGLFYIYFGSEKKIIDKCFKLIYKELKKLCEVKLTTAQLYTAKKQFIGQIGIASDNKENIALSLGKNFYYFNHFNSLDEIKDKIERISSQQILEVCNEIFDMNKISSLTYY